MDAEFTLHHLQRSDRAAAKRLETAYLAWWNSPDKQDKRGNWNDDTPEHALLVALRPAHDAAFRDWVAYREAYSAWLKVNRLDN